MGSPKDEDVTTAKYIEASEFKDIPLADRPSHLPATSPCPADVDPYDWPVLPVDAAARKKIRKRILRNVCLISLVFLMNFTAFSGLSALQSSLHREEGMGTITQSCLYGALVLSCMFVPKLLITSVGHKWTIPISLTGYILWMVANGYAVWGTMITASILVGLCAAPLWTAQCSYFTKLAPVYGELAGVKEEDVVTNFFGIFFCFFQISGLIGSTISSTILQPEKTPENETLTPEEAEMYCGVNDCPWNNITNPNLADPGTNTLWTLVGVYLAVACGGLVVACTAVQDLPKYLQDDKAHLKQQACSLALKTFRHLKNKSQCLLIPLTIYSGLEQGYWGAEWTKSFVSCSLGLWMVGFVSMPGSAANALTALCTGRLVKYTGRLPIFTFGACLHLALFLVMLFWNTNPDVTYPFFLIAVAWGICDGIWQTQINALYGAIFIDESEAAFSNYRMWESVGFIISYAYSSFLCTDIKIYINISVLVVGMAGYYIAENSEKKVARKRNAAAKQAMGDLYDGQSMDSMEKLHKNHGPVLPPVEGIENGVYHVISDSSITARSSILHEPDVNTHF